jgi:hypothetical protein
VVSFDGSLSAQDWYGLEWNSPKEFRQVSFCHGKSFHDGGWFDTSRGKPRIEIKRAQNGSWEEIGRLKSYPDTTSASDAGIAPGQRFECNLDMPIRAVAVRVVGVPASGDNPSQNFSSCAELTVR